MTYTMRASVSGITETCTAKTLAGAKREASKWISFGGGSVTVYANGEPIATRKFWRYSNRFGWGPWSPDGRREK